MNTKTLSKVIKAEFYRISKDRRYYISLLVFLASIIALYLSDILKFLMLRIAMKNSPDVLYYAVTFHLMVFLIPVVSYISPGLSFAEVLRAKAVRYIVPSSGRIQLVIARAISGFAFLSSIILAALILLSAHMLKKGFSLNLSLISALFLFLAALALAFSMLYNLIAALFPDSSWVALLIVLMMIAFQKQLGPVSVFSYLPESVSAAALISLAWQLAAYSGILTLLQAVSVWRKDL